MTPVGEDAGERPRKRRLVLEIEARATECGPCVGRVANHCRPFADLLEYRLARYMRVDACRAAETALGHAQAERDAAVTEGVSQRLAPLRVAATRHRVMRDMPFASHRERANALHALLDEVDALVPEPPAPTPTTDSEADR